MTFTEAAEIVLRQVGKPLHFKKITQLAIEQNLLSHVGKTPEITMSTRLATMTKKDKGDAAIVRVKPGVFALRAWGEDAVAAAADVEESDEPVVPELAEEEEPAAPRSAEEREREDLLAAAQTVFAAEDDDDMPVMADRPAPVPVASATAGAVDPRDEGGRRRRGRRRRRGGRGTDRDQALDGEAGPADADGEFADDADGDRDERTETELGATDGDRSNVDAESTEFLQADRGESAAADAGADVPTDELGADSSDRRPSDDTRPRETRDTRDGRDRPSRDGRDGRDNRDNRDRGGRDQRDVRARDDRDSRARDSRDGRDRPGRDGRDSRDNRDARDNRDNRPRDDRNDRDRFRDGPHDSPREERAPSEETIIETGRDACDLLVSLLQRREDRSGTPLRTLVDDAIRGGKLAGDATVLTASLVASARAENARREALGDRPRFRLFGSRISLLESQMGGELLRAEEDAMIALDRLRDAARRQVIRRMNELPQSGFVELVATTLARVGLGAVRSVRRPGTNQGELYLTATASVAGNHVPAAVLLKRGGEIGRERVIELRGSLHHFNDAKAAWIVTTGNILSGAREEANAADAAAVTLIDGAQLSRWMDEFAVGLRQSSVSIPYIDFDLFDSLRG